MKPHLIKVRNCKDVVAYVCENLGYGLTTQKCRDIRKHLKSCPNCTAYLDSLRKTVTLYKSTPNPKLPGFTRKKLHSVLKLSR